MRYNNRSTYAVAVKDGKTLLYRHENLADADAKRYIGHYTLLWVQRKLDLTHFIVYCPDQPPVSIFLNFFQEEAQN